MDVEYPDIILQLMDTPMAIELLDQLATMGGEATLRQLKRRTGWETYHVDYRADVCEGLRLIQVKKLREDVPGKTERKFTLNEVGAIVLDDWYVEFEEPSLVDDDDPAAITVGEWQAAQAQLAYLDEILEGLAEIDEKRANGDSYGMQPDEFRGPVGRLLDNVARLNGVSLNQ